MPDNLFLYFVLLAAIASGFALGWLTRRRARSQQVHPRVYQSLNHLLNDRHDLAVDALIDDLGFDEVTFGTYLALGAALRKRGEVDKAINVHQNLLARPSLSKAELQQVELELATDYFGAGLYGRAETLLQEIIAQKGDHRSAAERLLVGVYERESEWAKALAVARDLVKQDRSQAQLAAHLCCELAQAQLLLPPEQQNLDEARQHLTLGRKLAPDVARLSLMTAEIELRSGSPRAACKALDRALDLEPDLAVDLFPTYAQATQALGDTKRYLTFLERAIVDPARAPVALLLEQARVLCSEQSPDAAQTLLLERLPQIQSAAQLAGILDELITQALAQALDAGLHGQFVQQLQSLLLKHQDYRCQNCGFGASSRHWRCPSCHQWGAWQAAA